MPEIPRIISVDDHVVEPADVWQKRLPKKYLDVGPRVERAPLGEMAARPVRTCRSTTTRYQSRSAADEGQSGGANKGFNGV
jgi:hypothetical protein